MRLIVLLLFAYLTVVNGDLDDFKLKITTSAKKAVETIAHEVREGAHKAVIFFIPHNHKKKDGIEDKDNSRIDEKDNIHSKKELITEKDENMGSHGYGFHQEEKHILKGKYHGDGDDIANKYKTETDKYKESNIFGWYPNYGHRREDKGHTNKDGEDINHEKKELIIETDENKGSHKYGFHPVAEQTVQEHDHSEIGSGDNIKENKEEISEADKRKESHTHGWDKKPADKVEEEDYTKSGSEYNSNAKKEQITENGENKESHKYGLHHEANREEKETIVNWLEKTAKPLVVTDEEKQPTAEKIDSNANKLNETKDGREFFYTSCLAGEVLTKLGCKPTFPSQ